MTYDSHTNYSLCFLPLPPSLRLSSPSPLPSPSSSMQGNVSSNFFARGFGTKNEGTTPTTAQQSNRLSPPSLTLKGAAAETAMFTVLEGVSGGLEALILTLRKNGDWARIRAIRDRLIEVFAMIAVDVYAYQEGNPLSVLYCTVCAVLHCQCCIALSVLYCTVCAILHCQCCIALSVLYCTVCAVLYCLYCIALSVLY